MSDALWIRGYYGDQFVLVDGTEVLELRTEAEARRFLEELGEKAIEAVDPRALPSGLRNDFEGASDREGKLAVLAQMLSSGQFTVVGRMRPAPNETGRQQLLRFRVRFGKDGKLLTQSFDNQWISSFTRTPNQSGPPLETHNHAPRYVAIMNPPLRSTSGVLLPAPDGSFEENPFIDPSDILQLLTLRALFR